MANVIAVATEMSEAHYKVKLAYELMHTQTYSVHLFGKNIKDRATGRHVFPGASGLVFAQSRESIYQ